MRGAFGEARKLKASKLSSSRERAPGGAYSALASPAPCRPTTTRARENAASIAGSDGGAYPPSAQ